jgi:hypothetical protein
MSREQNYANHTRWHPLQHFVVTPLVIVHFFYELFALIREPTLDRADDLLAATLLVLISILVRINPLRAQDRIIRLEEQLRMARVLPPELAQRAATLRTGQIVALRFASDEELPALVRQVLDGKLTTGKEIKQAIRHWRPDHLRV